MYNRVQDSDWMDQEVLDYLEGKYEKKNDSQVEDWNITKTYDDYDDWNENGGWF